jgi:hypothetical protein
MNRVKPWSDTYIRLKSKLLRQVKHSYSAPIQTVHVPAVCQRWRRSRLTQTCRPHLFPNSSSPSNQPNALPPKFPYPCMHYTPINTHSGMPTYYGGPLRHGGSATVETRRFRLPARYCFLSLVRFSLVRDGGDSRSDSHLFLAERARTKTKNKIVAPLLRFACVCSLRLL